MARLPFFSLTLFQLFSPPVVASPVSMALSPSPIVLHPLESPAGTAAALVDLRSLGRLNVLNEKRWFPAAERVLKLLGVFSYVIDRTTSPPLLPDRSNLAQVREYERGLHLASHIFERYAEGIVPLRRAQEPSSDVEEAPGSTRA